MSHQDYFAGFYSDASKDPVNASIWTHIRDCGGWHSVHEVGAKFKEMRVSAIDARLRAMVNVGVLERKNSIESGVYVYGVTAECEKMNRCGMRPSTC